QPGIGSNYVTNGDLESGLLAPWTAIGGHSSSTASTNVAHSGNYSLHIIASGGGSFGSTVQQSITTLNPTTTYTFSMWYLSSTNGSGLQFRSTTAFRTTGAPISYHPVQSTPGTTNSVAFRLPPFPAVWLNELQPNNVTGLTDNAGDRDPWVELYNSGTNTISLNGWYLADNYTILTRWAFPPGTSIGPGEFKLVWLDAEPGESTPTSLHASFRVASTSGSVALVFPLNGAPVVLDYINYDVTGERSVGFYPDGQFGLRKTFFVTTPGAPNNNTAAPLTIYVNEWMAANTTFLADPADGDFDDWFELYNPNDAPVDLTGYSLSDSLAAGAARWSIPAGTTIPAFGYLLVWADSETGQNATNRIDLHANFRLSQTGEAIGLFAPNGTLVDGVTFGAQTNNISQGRWPNGAANTYHMPTPTPRAGNVIPNPPPAEIRITQAFIDPAGDMVMTWSAEAGRTYRVQFKDDLNAAWSNLANVTAVGSSASRTNTITATPLQRFYRIQLLTP
ncbi:MAG TPA: lamin tail domain-containing protein, partial [Candidatus Binatia bacterium]|nr:lamin tail domain-containing protein [Candidatus Binatia bacterium]